MPAERADASTRHGAPEILRAMGQDRDESVEDVALASTQASIPPAPVAPKTKELHAGMVLHGTYELERRLGQGGMGEVWKAKHLRLPKPVAIKVLLPSIQSSGEVVARFQREAEIGSRLAHPNIVHVFDFNTLEDGRRYLAMDFLEGEALADRMERGRMRYAEVAPIVEQAGLGLRVAHEAGVVHRDLKPDNLFLANDPNSDPPYRVKILDFGISKIQTADRSLTRDQAVMGTPGYMAPEQAMGQTAKLGPEADQFSLGAIVYEMLSGEIAFGGTTLAEIVLKVVQETPPPLEEVAPDVPAHAAAAVRRAMAKDPAERFPSVAEFVAAFLGRGAAASPAVGGVGASSGGAIPATATYDEPVESVAPPAAAPARSASPSAPTLGADEVAAAPAEPAMGGGTRLGLVALAVVALVGGGVAVGLSVAGGGEDEASVADGAGPSSSEAERGGTDEATAPGDGANDDGASEASANDGASEAGPNDDANVAGPNGDGANEAAADDGASEAATPDDGANEAATPDDGANETAAERNDDAPRVTMRGASGMSALPPEVRELLEQARAALGQGDSARALQLAQRSIRVQRTPVAFEIMAKAYCLRHDLGGANAMARNLRGAARRRATRFCARHDVTLAR